RRGRNHLSEFPGHFVAEFWLYSRTHFPTPQGRALKQRPACRLCFGEPTMKSLAASLLALLVAGAVAAADTPPAFTKKPTASKPGDKVKIEFAVDRATDVAVYIEDGEGKVIRHLAGGVLGKNAPEPLQRDSFSQSLEWDGKDNFGKPAAGGPFKVRVRLGMKPEFDGFLLYNRDSAGEISTVAVGPGGNLYVFHKDGVANGNMGGHKIKVSSRDGKHLKVLLPFPADIAPEKVRGAGTFQSAEGDLVPHVHNWETLSFY